MSFQLKPVIDAVQSRCTTAVDTAQEALTSGRAEVNSVCEDDLFFSRYYDRLNICKQHPTEIRSAKGERNH